MNTLILFAALAALVLVALAVLDKTRPNWSEVTGGKRLLALLLVLPLVAVGAVLANLVITKPGLYVGLAPALALLGYPIAALAAYGLGLNTRLLEQISSPERLQLCLRGRGSQILIAALCTGAGLQALAALGGLWSANRPEFYHQLLSGLTWLLVAAGMLIPRPAGWRLLGRPSQQIILALVIALLVADAIQLYVLSGANYLLLTVAGVALLLGLGSLYGRWRYTQTVRSGKV